MNKYRPLLLSITVSSLLYSQAMRVNAEENNVEAFNLSDLPSLELDELLAADVQVTSAMKRLQNVSDTAASIYVLSHDEIMSSGVTSVAQALKLVPGMQVRQIDNNQWAITSRSTAGRYSSKLLVMVDGQSIYNPVFAGVYWESINLPLFDIERIEVIRGQGGLLWGSNATNGVVNIITKHTSDTKGMVAEIAAGNLTEIKTSFRLGGDIGKYNSFRTYGSIERTNASSNTLEGFDSNDDGEKKNVGGRIDLTLNDDLSIRTQLDYSDISMGQLIKVPDLTTYENYYVEDQYTRKHLQFMTRAEQRLSKDSNQMLQLSLSSQRGEQLILGDEFLITDIDYQMNTLINDIQFDWGLNYRYNYIDITDSDYISEIKEINSYQHAGGFVQALFDLQPDKLKLIVGNRTEYNTFTGWEHQPMARIMWHPQPKHNLWASVSKGVRIPSLVEYNGIALINGVQVSDLIDGSTGSTSVDETRIKAQIVGSDDIEAETSLSKELGYRYTEDNWGIDIALFHTKSKNVMALERTYDEDVFNQIAVAIASQDYVTAASLLSSTTYDLNFVSNAELTTYGGEATIKWQPLKQLKTELGYSYTSYKYNLPENTRSAIGDDAILRQILLKAHYSITPNHSLFALYRIEGGDGYGTNDFSVLDLSWMWHLTPDITVSLTGNNLLYGKHYEYQNTNETYTVPTYIEPSYLGKITMEF